MKSIFRILFLLTLTFLGLSAQNKTVKLKLTSEPFLLPPFPSVPAKLPEDSVTMGDWRTFPEMKLDIPITAGPFEPTWESIEKNYPGEPAWLREAKVGIWVHFGPQSAGESGDWYARKIYTPGTSAYNNHLKRYGHPSEVGYKEVLRDWNLTLADGKGKWYATQWALRMMDVVEHYDLDFIYTDGTVLGPFTGNAMQTVMADYYLSDENAVHYIHCVQNRLRGSTT